MKNDVVFFLKSSPTASISSLDWPAGTKLIGVDPPRSLMCGGSDPRCSTAYSNLYSSLRDADGRVLPRFLERYAKGMNVGRVSFVGFSAAHGFLNPLANQAADRDRISAYVLMDASFGGGKTGYLRFIEDAAAGKRLLVVPTSDNGSTELNRNGWASWKAVWNEAERTLGTAQEIPVRAPALDPAEGVWRLGKLAFNLRYTMKQIPHWELGRIIAPTLDGYLVPYLRGDLGGSMLPKLLGGLIAAAGIGYAWRSTRRGR